MRRRQVDDAEIVRLYRDEGFRAKAIARRIGVTDALVYDRLERSGVARSRFAHLPLDEITRLYVDERLTTPQIAAEYGVSNSTVAKRLRGAGVALRGRSGPRDAPARRPCPRSRTFRAYVLGLVWGDFAVERHTVDGKAVRVKTSTTRVEQVDLTRQVFGPFGAVRHSGRCVWVMLDESFSFVEVKYGDSIP